MARSTGEVGREGQRRRAGGARSDGVGLRQRIVQVIKRYHRQHDQWPTYREIGALVGIESTSHIAHHVAMLVKQGILTHQPGISRGIALARAADAHDPAPHSDVPILGRIAAGAPLDLFETGEPELLDLGDTADGPGGGDVFALRVVGDSMIGDGILDGDYVLVRRGKSAANGAIAVVVERRTNGGRGAATLKRFFNDETSVRLQPANPAHEPIIIGRTDWDRDWEVQGTAVGVYRRMDGKR